MGVLFKWSDECEESFQKLKTALNTTPVLVLPTTSGSYTVCYDVSWVGIQCLLMQDGRVIAYASHELKPYEKSIQCTIWSEELLYTRSRFGGIIFMVHQYDDSHLLVLKDAVQHEDAKEVTIGDDWVLRLHGIGVPNVDGLRELILEEAYSLWYSIHPDAAKMYIDLKQYYRWRRIKKDIVDLVQLDKDLTYVEQPVAILNKQVHKLRAKNTALVKV
ncbi:uncharacterized protein [Nicotiana tomentosiformis]|uniref:uncharacterized protein n=1 Tax=Nicotiana tomentosiformis TaxID=4098 RepID=UPI00388CE96B